MRFKIFFAVVLLLLLLSGAAKAEVPQTGGTPEAAGLNQASRQDLYQRWTGIRKKLGGKDFEGARIELMELQGRCADLGITSFEELSSSMIKVGKTLLDGNDTKGAIMLFDFASKISPQYPPAYFAKGWAYFEQDKFKVLLTIDSFIDGFRNSLDDFWWVFFFAGNKIASLLFALAALFSLYGLFIAVRYTPLLAHDLSEIFKRRALEKFLKYFLLPVFFLLVLILLGYWWAVLSVFLLLWIYFNKKEKFFALVFFALLIFMPEIMNKFTNFLQAGGNRLLWVMDDANKGKFTPSSEDFLLKLVNKEPDNEAALSALALIDKKQGKYGEAEIVYKKLLSIRPDSPVYLNNLGNIYFLTKRNDEALNCYNTAIKSDPKGVLPYFNMSQIYAENLMFTEREKADLTARELDPNLMARLRDIPGNSPQRMVFDEQIPHKMFWEISFKESNPAMAGAFWEASVKVLPLSGTRLAGISFLILVFAVNAFRKKGVYSRFCQKCGKVSCRKCQKPFYNKDLCPQCHQMFVKLEGVEAKDRVRKMLEIREAGRRQGILYRILSLFIPGSGHFLLGHPIRGFLFMGIIIFAIKDIFWGNLFQVPYDLKTPFIQPDILVLATFATVIYFVTQIDTHKITK